MFLWGNDGQIWAVLWALGFKKKMNLFDVNQTMKGILST